MKRTTWRWGVTGCGAVAMAGALGVAWLRAEAVALRAERAAAQSEAGEVERLRAENARLREQGTPAEEVAKLRAKQAEVRRLRAEIEALERSAEESGRAAGSGAGERTPVSGNTGISARIEARYAEFLAGVTLPAARVEDLKRLLGGRQERELEAVAEARRRQGDPNALAVKQEAIDGRAAVEARMRAEFGEAIYAQFREHEWALSARHVVTQLERMLERTPTPLRKEQAERLVPLLAAARGGGEFVAEDWARGVMPYRVRVTPETLRAAGAVLAPVQLKTLEAIATEP